jgi:hypothetical protein
MDRLVALFAFAVLLGFVGILLWHVPRLDLIVLPSSFACSQAACCGARRVRLHSSSMSHFTASRRFSIASSSGSGQASSTRWPFGSKK